MSKVNLKIMNLFGEELDVKDLIREHLEQLILRGDAIDWMDDQDVCNYLRISSSTLGKFRELENIYYTRVGQKLLYIRQSIDYVLIKVGMVL